jgi:hypothetical protein
MPRNRCICTTLTLADDDDLARIEKKMHHSHCPMYAREEKPRLFYYEQGIDCWTPFHGDIAAVVGPPDNSIDMTGRQLSIEIEFRWQYMTDEEFDNMEEA